MANLRELTYSIKYDVDNKGLKQTESAADGITSKLQGANSQLLALGKTAVGAFAGKQLLNFGKAVTGVVKSSVAEFANFEQGMAQVKATIGDISDEDFTALETAARASGKETKFSAIEAAEGLNFMALAGYDAQESVDALPKVLKFASAGNIDLARASDLATDALSVVQLEVKDMTKLTDIFVKSSTSANQSTSQFAEGFIQVGGVAKNFGLNLVETNAELGILANNGLKGSEGAVALRNSLNKLLAPNRRNAELIKELGLNVTNADGSFRNFDNIMVDLRDNLSKYNQAQQTAIISQIAGAENLRGFNILLSNAGKNYNNLATNIKDFAGASEEAAKTQEDTIQGSIRSIQSAWSDALISITKDEDIKALVQDFAKSFKEEIPGIVKGLKAVVKGFVNMGKFVLDNKEIIIPVVTGITAGVTALGVAMTAAGIAASVAFLGISAPVLAVSAAIAGVIALGVAMARNWDKVGEVMNGVWEGIKWGIRGLAQFIVNIVTGFINIIFTPIDFLISSLNTISFDVPKWVPKIGGKHFGFDIPHMQIPHIEIPQFADGTNNAPGGPAIINEQGGEIVNLPGGSQVIPHDVSMKMAKNTSAPTNKIDIHLTIEGNVYGEIDLENKIKNAIEDVFLGLNTKMGFGGV